MPSPLLWDCAGRNLSCECGVGDNLLRLDVGNACPQERVEVRVGEHRPGNSLLHGRIGGEHRGVESVKPLFAFAPHCLAQFVAASLDEIGQDAAAWKRIDRAL